MPIAQPPETMTLRDLMTGLARFTNAQRNAQERDVVVPTPQQQSAARKRALLERARELGILDEVLELPREALTRRVNAAAREAEPEETEDDEVLDEDTF